MLLYNIFEGMKNDRKRFSYRVKDKKGRVTNGRVVATSAGQVQRALSQRDYTILSVIEEKSFLQKFSLGSVKARDRSIAYRELATMLKAGVSITQAITIVAETPNKKLREVFADISSSLENGFALSVAMSGHPKVFPAVEVGVVRAGEATGNLSKVLEQLADTTERSADFNSKVKGAMIYPGFIFVVMIIIGTVIMIKVIPPIKDIFTSTGTELPTPTKILLGITDILTNYWIYLILGIIILLIAGKFYFSTKSGHRFGSYLGLNVPVIGVLMRQVYLAQFNRTLSLLVSAGVPIIEAVEIITESTTNVIFREALEGLMHSLEQGAAITSSMKNSKYFPKIMTQLLSVGTQSGDLGGTAETLASYFETEVDGKLRSFSALIEPFIIVILGLGVGFVIISVLQPIYSLTGQF